MLLLSRPINIIMGPIFYQLETILVNPKEDLFFHDTKLVSHIDQRNYWKELHSIIDPLTIDKRLEREQTRMHDIKHGWMFISKFGKFASIDDAVYFYKELSDSTRLFQKLKSKWQVDNAVFAEANVVENNGGLVKTVHSCQQNVCVIYGTCDTGSGCDKLKYRDPSLTVRYHKVFPIVSK